MVNWICEICGKNHFSEISAQNCEKRHQSENTPYVIAEQIKTESNKNILQFISTMFLTTLTVISLVVLFFGATWGINITEIIKIIVGA